jgi:hypothetical protein
MNALVQFFYQQLLSFLWCPFILMNHNCMTILIIVVISRFGSQVCLQMLLSC